MPTSDHGRLTRAARIHGTHKVAVSEFGLPDIGPDELLHLPADRLFPLGDTPWDASAKLLALPALEDIPPTVHAGALGDVQQ